MNGVSKVSVALSNRENYVNREKSDAFEFVFPSCGLFWFASTVSVFTLLRSAQIYSCYTSKQKEGVKRSVIEWKDIFYSYFGYLHLAPLQ
jgi:hypothetical protein